MCRSLTVPEKVQSLARRISMGLSSFWESVSGGIVFFLPVPKYGSEVPSPAGECRPEMIGGGAQTRSVSQSSGTVWGTERDWEILGFLHSRLMGPDYGELGQQEARSGELCAITAVSSVFVSFGSQFCSCSMVDLFSRSCV